MKTMGSKRFRNKNTDTQQDQIDAIVRSTLQYKQRARKHLSLFEDVINKLSLARPTDSESAFNDVLNTAESSLSHFSSVVNNLNDILKELLTDKATNVRKIYVISLQYNTVICNMTDNASELMESIQIIHQGNVKNA